MELALSLGVSQSTPPALSTGNLNLGLWFSPETAMESRGQELQKPSDSNDLPLRLGLKLISQSMTTEPVMSPSRGEASVTSREGGDEENGLPSWSRKKLRLSKDQYVYLEERFKKHQNLNPKQKRRLAKELGLHPRQVEVWFQNRRARTKLKKTELDCAYFRRCCDTLTAENQQLRKQLADLRALKAALMQLPATTLSLCHSCERISATSGGGDNRKNASVAALLNNRGFFQSHRSSAATGVCPKMAPRKYG